ncbi:hypothetical protein FQB35_07725 [Crassaminicella thermophila]|uniref:Flagellar hook-length control protein-like C-terminal domain-containing protein n=1 Tax=Crassaminicella thermophila TaxID=2599308 RepID=A0A5C0SFY0_CRATE|nr:flagellar hook-length control protein FliK [Crassaminicella thermophila]QEK12274.1 hypothetical protein FQB35_07725 [Crassaminicella thermophila]
MNPLIISTSQQLNSMQQINNKKNSSEDNNNQSFDDILNKKVEEIKEDGLEKLSNTITNEEKNIQSESIEKKDTSLNDKDARAEDVTEDIINLIAFLYNCINESNKNYKNDECQNDEEFTYEELKVQLLSAIDNASQSISSNKELLGLLNDFKILLEDENIKVQTEDFEIVFSKIKDLLTINKNEATDILPSELPKINLTELNTNDNENKTENIDKSEVFSNIHNKTDSNTENETNMFYNKEKDTKNGFFASKNQKVLISDESIKDVNVQYITQKNIPIMESIKTEITNQNKPNFYNILGQVVEKAQVLIGDRASEMTLQLKPDHLGKLSMKIVVERGIVVANIVAENQAVKEVLESNFNLLKDALNEKGFGIQELNVSVGQDSSFKEQQSFMKFKKKHTGKIALNKAEYEQSIFIGTIDEISDRNSTINHLG